MAETCTCGKEGLLKCGSCLGIKYCSKECQKLDWKEHKMNCMEIYVERRAKEIIVNISEEVFSTWHKMVSGKEYKFIYVDLNDDKNLLEASRALKVADLSIDTESDSFKLLSNLNIQQLSNTVLVKFERFTVGRSLTYASCWKLAVGSP